MRFRFTLVQKHTVEFNQVAMANSEGSEAMLNRVMTKDNIGVAVVLEVRKELFGTGWWCLWSPPSLLMLKNEHSEFLATGFKSARRALAGQPECPLSPAKQGWVSCKTSCQKLPKIFKSPLLLNTANIF